MAGSLVVAVTVEADGTTHDIQLRRGLGFGLDEAGVEAVSRWRFNPALDKEGNPIATKVAIEVAFRLL
jgi:TonB family protein